MRPMNEIITDLEEYSVLPAQVSAKDAEIETLNAKVTTLEVEVQDLNQKLTDASTPAPVPAPTPTPDPVPAPTSDAKFTLVEPNQLENMQLQSDVYTSLPGYPKAGPVALHFNLGSAGIKYGSRVVMEWERAIKINRNVTDTSVLENIKDWRAWVSPIGSEHKNNLVMAQPYYGWYFLFVENVATTTHWTMKPPPSDGTFFKEKIELIYPTALSKPDGIVRRWINGILVLEAKGVQFEGSGLNVGLPTWFCLQLHTPNWNEDSDSFLKVKKAGLSFKVY